MLAINMQTPSASPFGFSLFYLRSVAHPAYKDRNDRRTIPPVTSGPDLHGALPFLRDPTIYGRDARGIPGPRPPLQVGSDGGRSGNDPVNVPMLVPRAQTQF